MNLSEHFSLEEFTASETAGRRGIDNDLPASLYQTARDTCEMLERIRALLGRLANRNVSVMITSGYRSIALNRAIGSGDTSDHVRGQAADIRAPSFGTSIAIARALAPHIDTLGIGQLINEFPGQSGWAHVSTRTPSNPVNRIITITGRGTVAGIVG